MAWSRFDDGYMDHPKVMEAGPWAELLDRRAIEHCAKYETDGIVSKASLRRIGRDIPRVAQRVLTLVEVGRWSAVDGGWEVHDFLQYNPSKAEREELREANRERQRKWREKAKRNGVTNSLVTNGSGTKERDVCENCEATDGWLEVAAGTVKRCDHAPQNVTPLRAVSGNEKP